MILSVSRRTDIPALYSDWFMNRLRAGEVLVRNPVNPGQVSSLRLSPENIDCIVFWTKDPLNLIPHLDEIDRLGYKYYFSITINPYGRDIECNVDYKKNIIEAFRELSGKIGPLKMIWRYDPILFTGEIDREYHLKWFDYLSAQLGDYTGKCVFSFLEEYKKLKTNLADMNIFNPPERTKRELIGSMSAIAKSHSIKLASCGEMIDFSDSGIEGNRCIDDVLIEKILGCRIKVSKDRSQRKECNCVVSRDIGTYNTCTNGCVYCYANIDKISAANCHSRYSTESPLLCDSLKGDERVSPYKNCGSLKIYSEENHFLQF